MYGAVNGKVFLVKEATLGIVINWLLNTTQVIINDEHKGYFGCAYPSAAQTGTG